MDTLNNAKKLNDVELKIRLEEDEHTFTKKFKPRKGYIHLCVAGNDVLISSENMANFTNFNGYIELSSSMAFFGMKLKNLVYRQNWNMHW